MNAQVNTTQPLSSSSSQVPGLTLRDKYHIQRAVGLICEGEERSSLAAFLGVADDEQLYPQALAVALNYLDTLVAVIERLTGNEENGITTEVVPGNTQVVDTSQIQIGDLVFNFGMRIRIDEIEVHEDETSHGGKVYCCLGTVLNVQEAIEQHDIPRSFMFNEARHVHGPRHPDAREDYWNVQGNDLARWTVVRQEA
jgi:hypothetical protein